jgi:hypothetical protein
MPKQKWKVIRNSTRKGFNGVDIGSEHRRFERDGTFVVDDPQLSRDIDKMYGRRGNQTVAVVPHNDSSTRELGHTYTFGPSKTFADAWEAFEKRRKDKKK